VWSLANSPGPCSSASFGDMVEVAVKRGDWKGTVRERVRGESEGECRLVLRGNRTDKNTWRVNRTAWTGEGRKCTGILDRGCGWSTQGERNVMSAVVDAGISRKRGNRWKG